MNEVGSEVCVAGDNLFQRGKAFEKVFFWNSKFGVLMNIGPVKNQKCF